MKKLFAFDIDGTLLDHSTYTVPSSALEAIKKLRKNGHIVGIATGRNRSQTMNVINPKDFDFIILLNGGYLEIDGVKVKSNNFSKEQATKINSMLDQYNMEYTVSNHDKNHSQTPSSEKVMRVINFFNVDVPDLETNLQNLETYQYSVCEYPEQAKLLHELDSFCVFHALAEFGFDICKKDVNKGAMLREVAQMFDVDMEHTFAFGDADNDQEFLRFAGTGIAMGNASEKAKANADHITTHVGDNGISNAIKKFGFIG